MSEILALLRLQTCTVHNDRDAAPNMLQHLQNTPHRRYNPLTDEWVLVSPHRLQRPWQGKTESVPSSERPTFDSKCYLCPGNERAGGKVNPAYEDVFVFNNDFAALLPETSAAPVNHDSFIVAQPETGQCRVVCFSPRHDLTLPEMETPVIRRVVDTWASEYLSLRALPDISYIQIFENKGALMGCSNPHPHGQIWATQTVPVEPSKELEMQAKFATEHDGKCLLCEYVQFECAAKERIIAENESWLVVAPFWAKWPYEMLLLSKRHLDSLPQLEDSERDLLASILKEALTRYDNLFEISFPYTMGFHQSPTDGNKYESMHLHAHFYPPLLRSATVQKFMVGFEMLATPQRDFSPEYAAERLRAVSPVHFRAR